MKNELPQEVLNEIRNHKGDYKTLWKIYGGFKDGLYRSKYFRISIILSFISVVLCYFIDGIYSLKILNDILDKVLSILPNIIGFNIGAYALVIGFGQKSIIDKMTSTVKEGDSFTLFQKMGSTFAFSVLIQSITIMLSFLLQLFIQNFSELNFLNLPDCLINYINGTVFFLMLFMTLYSFLLIPQIVINVFGFSQLYHFYSRNSKNDDNKSE